MKKAVSILVLIITMTSCNSEKKHNPIEGTWRLISAETIEKDSTFSTFNSKTKMIKIINDSHFAFFNHDLNNGKDSTNAVFFGGGGKYTLKDSIYTENLEYFNNLIAGIKAIDPASIAFTELKQRPLIAILPSIMISLYYRRQYVK